MSTIKNIFEKEVSDEIINRINQLSNNQKAVWGKMSVDKMLAPVSYTHLDVYKRQLLKIPRLLCVLTKERTNTTSK